MIVDLPSSTTSAVNRKLVELRERGGVLALGRVLTLVIVTDDGGAIEGAIEAANSASREHPCRVIVLARGQRRAAPRLDAQIRVGGDAGASEVVVLRGYGALAADEAGAGMVMPLLLPDAPVVAWWPGDAPAVPSQDAIGRLAQRRITDALSARNPMKALEQRRAHHVAGDTDLTWTRLTSWRALLAAALDHPPYEPVTGAVVSGEAVSPSTELMAGWLAARLEIRVKRSRAENGQGLVSVRLSRPSGPVELVRPDGKVGSLRQPGQPERLVALARRSVPDCLSEELRRLDPDEIYAAALAAVGQVARGRTPLKTPAVRVSRMSGPDVGDAELPPELGAPVPVSAAEQHVLVDAANVVGSRPDGWWRDRAGAARRLAGRLVAALVADPADLAAALVGTPRPEASGLRVHLVLEGAARSADDLPTHPQLVVHRAEGDGDATIAALAADLARDGRGAVVAVTADRALRERVRAAGGSCVGPGTLLRALPE